MFDVLEEQRSNLHIVIGAYWKDPEDIIKQIMELTKRDMECVFKNTMNMDEATVTKKTHIRYVMDVFFDAIPAPVETPVGDLPEEIPKEFREYMEEKVDDAG